MPKDRVNLLLDHDAVERGRAYCELHGTSLSQLVSEFFAALPTQESAQLAGLSPVVRRLLGAAAGGGDLEDYQRQLVEKYGG